jgi:hypothetical protein
MGFNLLMICGGVFASWVALSLVGGERQRRLNDIEAARIAAEEEAAAPKLGSQRPSPPKSTPAARQSTH